jgi:hypothetical protein
MSCAHESVDLGYGIGPWSIVGRGTVGGGAARRSSAHDQFHARDLVVLC